MVSKYIGSVVPVVEAVSPQALYRELVNIGVSSDRAAEVAQFVRSQVHKDGLVQVLPGADGFAFVIYRVGETLDIPPISGIYPEHVVRKAVVSNYQKEMKDLLTMLVVYGADDTLLASAKELLQKMRKEGL
jgi:hypothetical protein